MREVKLPSGATLKVKAAPFSDSKALYQAVLKEMRGVELKSETRTMELYKNLFCAGFSSKEIESTLVPCLERCTYNDHKIGPDTFEADKAREDYVTVCVEVAKENISPFLKSLYAECQRISVMFEKSPA